MISVISILGSGVVIEATEAGAPPPDDRYVLVELVSFLYGAEFTLFGVPSIMDDVCHRSIPINPLPVRSMVRRSLEMPAGHDGIPVV
jgi:hypothetical protein